ncbi:MAG: FAD-dependent oxidoreductase [Hyphomicrobium sp.]|nr:MAG: FAD-dependent oxidoreductase [Hyphomicrobium sp.]
MTTSKISAPTVPRTISCDAVVIGGGHNGLVTGAYLAAAGVDTLIVEKNDTVGGAAVTEEFVPGFRNSVAAYTVSLLNIKVVVDLELERYGLEIVERPAANFWPVDDRRSLFMPYDLAGRQAAIAAFSPHDAERLADYDKAMLAGALIMRDLLLRTPPNVKSGIMSIMRGLELGRDLVRMPVGSQRLLLDLMTTSAADFLGQWFESDVVKGAFAFDSIVGAYASPSTPGTAYVLLHHCFGETNGKSGVWGHAIGGMGAITQAMAQAAEARGAKIRKGSGVARVLIEGGRAAGVVLDNGDEIRARVVASNVAPKLLFSKLVPEAAVEPELRRHFTGMKTGSGTFRMNVALSELPSFTCRPGTHAQDHHGAGIIIGPSLGYLERAYFDARIHGWAKEPIVEMLIPSTIDRTLAPAGRHVASLFVQHVAPHLPDGRSWQNAHEKEAFADLVVETVTRHAPNFKSTIIGRQLLSPLDLEQRFGLPDGDIFHGQLSLDQLFSARPVLGHADYRMPIPGLYLCGSGGHPGGGVTGVPGHNAAREIIRDLKRRRGKRS